jgi:RHS repeat-associated protein
LGNPFRFQGQYADLDLGLIYMRARFYDPLTGTFLERDPLEYKDSVNLYAGLGQAPTSMRDPMGTASVTAKGGAIVLDEFLKKGAKEAEEEIGEEALDRIAREAVLQTGGESEEQVLNRVIKDALGALPESEAEKMQNIIRAESWRLQDEAIARRNPLLGDPTDAAFATEEEFLKHVNKNDFLFVSGHADANHVSVFLGGEWRAIDIQTLAGHLSKLRPETAIVFSACNFGADAAQGGAVRLSRLLPDRTIFAAEGFVRTTGNPRMLMYASMFEENTALHNAAYSAAWGNVADFDDMGGLWRGFQNGRMMHELSNTQFNMLIRK